MIIRQLTAASCTLACFESFLGQNGLFVTQRWMKRMRPDICGNLNDEQRCVYVHHYSEVGQAFGFTCSEITNVFVPYPRYPTSAVLMGPRPSCTDSLIRCCGYMQKLRAVLESPWTLLLMIMSALICRNLTITSFGTYA